MDKRRQGPYNTGFAEPTRPEPMFASNFRFTCVVALLFLSACTTTPTPRQQDTQAASIPAPATSAEALQRLPGLPSAQRDATAISWAMEYLSAGRLDAARQLIELLDHNQLSGANLGQWTLVAVPLKLAAQDSEGALELLSSNRLLMAEPNLSANQQARTGLLRADALALNGELLASVRERARINDLLDTDTRAYNQRMIWTQLMMLQPDVLVSERSPAGDSALDGWLELALIYRDPLADIDTQMRNLDGWQDRWPAHPAAKELPDMIRALRRAVRNRPDSIALLLPMNGPLAPAANAIRDGIMASYYSALSQGHPVPQIHFLDTGSADVITRYNEALALGARLIIGPLGKDQAATLASVPSLPVPTLTLNYVADDTLPEQLFQFGLAPEDEARQIAEQSIREGLYLAALLYPQGDWGSRVAQAFIDAYTELGGIVTSRTDYADNPTAATRALMDISQSEGRARQIRRLSSLPVEFEPRRRQDVDMVVMIASSDQARQLKPALNFHYAQDLQVLATSHVYGGTPAPQRDSDLNGIRFVDMPWILDNQSDLHRLTNQVWPDGHGRYERLFALGVDAYRLHARLPMLQALPDSFLPGVTGQLSLGEHRRLQRQLQWAWFTGGQPKRMPVVAGAGQENLDGNQAIVEPAAGN